MYSINDAASEDAGGMDAAEIMDETILPASLAAGYQ
jgi:hypothetical protein